MYSTNTHYNDTNSTLQDLRKKCLALDTPLEKILPKAEPHTPTTIADSVSRQLLFALVRRRELEETELRQAKDWLFSATYYVLADCGSADHTFFSLVRLAEARVDFLRSIQKTAPLRPERLTAERLERVIFDVLTAHELTGHCAAFLEKVKGVMESCV